MAIPKLLDLLAIEGAVVTIDAMGCQRAIARKVLERRADYVLAPKASQGTLRDDVEVFVAEQKANGFRDSTVSCSTTVDGVTDASRPARSPSSTTRPGSASAMTGPG